MISYDEDHTYSFSLLCCILQGFNTSSIESIPVASKLCVTPMPEKRRLVQFMEHCMTMLGVAFSTFTVLFQSCLPLSCSINCQLIGLDVARMICMPLDPFKICLDLQFTSLFHLQKNVFNDIFILYRFAC